MSTPTDPTGTDDDVAQLRRRLYQPSASDDDVQRYRSAAATIAPPPPAVPDAPAGRDRRKLAARVAIPAAVAATALLLGAVVATSSSTPTPTPTATSTPGPVSTVALAQNRTGPQPYSFQQDAESLAPLSLTTTETEAGVSFTGVGPGIVPLDRSLLPGHGGVIRVEMLTDTSDAVGWRMNRIATRADFSSYDQTLARGRAGQEMAPVTPVDVEYDGDPPMTIRVDAPPGQRWWLDLRLAPRSR